MCHPPGMWMELDGFCDSQLENMCLRILCNNFVHGCDMRSNFVVCIRSCESQEYSHGMSQLVPI